MMTVPFQFLLAQSPSELIEQWKEGAKAGNAPAMYQLGKMYEEGTRERKNLKKALRYYEQAATLKYDSAQYALGRWYEWGIEVVADPKMALKLYEMAAPTVLPAKYALATLYKKGTGTDTDLPKAVKLYLETWQDGYAPAQKALDSLDVDNLADRGSRPYICYKAAQGDMTNQYLAAQMYLNGIDGDVQVEKALGYLQQAADKGYHNAMIELGDLYYTGKVVPKNPRLAVLYYLKAANETKETKDGLDAKIRELEPATLLGPDNLYFLLYNARQNNPQSMYRLYQLYLNGTSDLPKNPVVALEYLEQAAMIKYTPAVMRMAHYYEEGLHIQQSFVNAFKYYEQAARLDLDSANYFVGEYLATGRAGQKDEQMAVHHFLIAANRGYAPAIERLKQYPQLSQYVDPADVEYVTFAATQGNPDAMAAKGIQLAEAGDPEALVWLKKAAEQRNPKAIEALCDIHLKKRLGTTADPSELIQWLPALAQNGKPEAYILLAEQYRQRYLTASDPLDLEFGLNAANSYLEVMYDKGQPADKSVFRTIGEILISKGDYNMAICYLEEYVLRFDEEKDSPAELIAALESQAYSYESLENTNSSLLALDICIKVYEQFAEHPALKDDPKTRKGNLIYRKGVIMQNLGNPLAACALYHEAQKLGVELSKDQYQLCLNAKP